MKKIRSLFSTGVALTCALLGTACTCTPPQPLTLENEELEVAANQLYERLCQSGVLDEIAEEYAEEERTPIVYSAPVTTNKLEDNYDLDVDSLSKQFERRLRQGRHMIVYNQSRGVDYDQARKEFLKRGNDNWSETQKRRPKINQAFVPDYSIRGDVRSRKLKTGDWLRIEYTISMALILSEGASEIWSDSVRIKREREF